MALLRAEVLPPCRQQESLRGAAWFSRKSGQQPDQQVPSGRLSEVGWGGTCIARTSNSMCSLQRTQSQIPRSASDLAVSGSTREAGAGEKFFRKMWLLFRAGSQLFPCGPELVGVHRVGRGSHHRRFTSGGGSVSRGRSDSAKLSATAAPPDTAAYSGGRPGGPWNGCPC